MDARKYVLPHYLKPGLDVVIVGSIVVTTSEAAGNYYAQSANKFWERLYQAGLTPRQLAPQEDSTVLDFGIGLTDLNKTESSSTDVGV